MEIIIRSKSNFKYCNFKGTMYEFLESLVHCSEKWQIPKISKTHIIKYKFGKSAVTF